MSARLCAVCEGSKNAGIHSRHHPEHHEYQDSTKPGLKVMSGGKRAYLDSEQHERAYSEAEAYCVGHSLGAPGRCNGILSPHHTMKRSVAGQAYSEANSPVVTLCTFLNDGIESIPEIRTWALTHTFRRAGEDYRSSYWRKEASHEHPNDPQHADERSRPVAGGQTRVRIASG